MASGFGIEVLAGEAQVEGQAFAVAVDIFIGRAVAEGFALPAPDDFAGLAGDLAWGAQVVGVDAEAAFEYACFIGKQSHRQIGQPDDLLPGLAIGLVFPQQMAGGVISKAGDLAVDRLFNALLYVA